MKKTAGVLAALVLLLLQVGGALAQSSDYETIESYKRRHQSLLDAVKAAPDMGQRDFLESEIGSLEREYGPHRTLLSEGLYPESFDASIARLREQLKKSTERLLLAEESRRDKVQIAEVTKKAEAAGRKVEEVSRQNEEYRAANERLSREVQELSGRIQVLTDENTGLLGKIKALQAESRKDKESIARLKELTDKLNANIRDRDELIVKMMDSLFDEYSKAGLTDAQKKNLLSIAQEHDYVSKIVTTIDGNIAFVETAQLTPQDVKLIRDQQNRLAAKWDGIKPYVGRLYPDEPTRARDITTVDGRLSDLKLSIGETTWKSIHRVFTGQNIPIEQFRNAGEFHSRVLAYIDGQLKNPSRGNYQLFRRQVWDSPIKDQWLPIIPTDELTAQQRSDIEGRIAEWEKKISALFWRWVIIGLFGTAVVAAAAVTILRKKKAGSGGLT